MLITSFRELLTVVDPAGLTMHMSGLEISDGWVFQSEFGPNVETQL